MKGFAYRLTEKTREVMFDKDFAEAYKKSEKDFTRNRRMGFVGVMAMSLNFLRKSLQMEIDNYMELLDPEIENPITKQAFSKARQKIDWGAFEYLFEMTGEKAIEAGVDAVAVSSALGHSQVSTTTSIYCHAFQETNARASSAIADVLDFSKKKAKSAAS